MDPTHYCRIWEVGLTLKCCHQRFRLKISGEVNVFCDNKAFFLTKIWDFRFCHGARKMYILCMCVFFFPSKCVETHWTVGGEPNNRNNWLWNDFNWCCVLMGSWIGWMFFDFSRDLVVNYRDLTDFVRENFRAFFGEIYGLVKYYLSFPRDPGSPSENGFMKHKH